MHSVDPDSMMFRDAATGINKELGMPLASASVGNSREREYRPPITVANISLRDTLR
jgi:hypothetical protein